jgi:hypothetical protein
VPVQTGPGAHRVSCTMGRGSLFWGGVKRSRRGVDHPHASSAEVKERVESWAFTAGRFKGEIIVTSCQNSFSPYFRMSSYVVTTFDSNAIPAHSVRCTELNVHVTSIAVQCARYLYSSTRHYTKSHKIINPSSDLITPNVILTTNYTKKLKVTL